MKATLTILSLMALYVCNTDSYAQCSITAKTETDPTCLCDGLIDVNINGTSPYTYLWSTGSTASTLTDLCAGTYSLTVTDGASNTCTYNTTLTWTGSMSNWPRRIGDGGGGGSETIWDMAVNDNSEVFVIGTFTDKLEIADSNFETCTLESGSLGIFLAKYDECGAISALNIIDCYVIMDTADLDLQLELTSNGYVCIGGTFSNEIDLGGPGVLTASATSDDVFLATYEQDDLEFVAQNQAGFLNFPSGTAGNCWMVDMYAQGQYVFITGLFEGSHMRFPYNPGGTFVNLTNNGDPGTWDLFIASYQATSSDIHRITASNFTAFSEIDRDDHGMAITATTDRIFFTCRLTDDIGDAVTYLVRIVTSTGVVDDFATMTSGNNYFEAKDMDVYFNGNEWEVFVAGYGFFENNNPGFWRATIMKYEFDCDWVASRVGGYLPNSPTSSIDMFSQVCVSEDGDVYGAGFFGTDGLRFGGLNPLPLYGNSTLFVLKTDHDLVPEWSGCVFDATGNSRCHSIAYDESSDLFYIGGSFTDEITFTDDFSQYTGITADNARDAYIARFVDTGELFYKNTIAVKSEPPLSHTIVYPNPSVSIFHIQAQSAPYKMMVRDISGRLILTDKSEMNECSINLESVDNGIYLLEIITLEKTETFSIFKQ